MNDFQFRISSLYRILDSDDQAPPADELDRMLRDWHQQHADVANADRERILATVWSDHSGAADERPILARIGRALTGRIARIAACIGIVAAIATVLLTPTRSEAFASNIITVAEGGELTALDKDGDRLGPCPLQHTDVDAEVTGPFTRVMVKQRYANPYPQKIEAVYTFPLSHRAAVDHMRIIVKGPNGERVVEGEVKEREAARQIYESAKASGYVASLLEQERPNIFTQSVANIEPGSTIIVEIGYLETLQRKDGVYTFDFPMTVGPRYVPGAVRTGGPQLPDGLIPRAGLVLLGPGQVEIVGTGSTLSPQAAQQILAAGTPIRMPTADWFERNPTATGPATDFVVTYANGSKETGQIYAGGSGQVNGRWFWFGSRGAAGQGFAADTDQVPDASRITPMPVKPPERAGHDVSMRVTIDSGGASLRDVKSALHEISTESQPGDGDRRGRTVIELKQKNAIPNRDFVLSWKSDENLIEPGVYAHMREADDATKGGYFAVVLDPPARVEEKDIPARELVFVLDTSGSMSGFPIEKAKEVMTRAIAAMRPQDTFNVITFAGSTNILWPEARTASDDNKLIARRFVDERQGGGGTEMMTAINAALKPLDRAGWLKPKELADLPADGRAVRVTAPMTALNESATSLDVGDGKSVRVASSVSLPTVPDRASKTLSLEGRWVTKDGDRVFVVDRASFERTNIAPTRIVMFLTDGLVGNEGAILQAVRDNAKTTRVFSFGIGQSVNRSLLDGIATEGRGTPEFVTLADDADAAVARFVRRIQSPVLVDIDAKFAGVEVTDVLPDPSKIPDLFDEQPLMLVGRYQTPGHGSLTLSGTTGAGKWEKTIDVALPESGQEGAAVPTLWARAKVDSIVAPQRAAIEQQHADVATRNAIVALGESYQIMTPFTSFVAVERGRVTIGGTPVLVQVPIELPEGTSWKGFFGENVTPANWFAKQPVRLGIDVQADAGAAREEALARILRVAPTTTPEASGSLYFLGGVHPEATELRATTDKLATWDADQNRVVAPDVAFVASPDRAGGLGGGGAGGGSGGSATADDSRKRANRADPTAVEPAGAVFRSAKATGSVPPPAAAPAAPTSGDAGAAGAVPVVNRPGAGEPTGSPSQLSDEYKRQYGTARRQLESAEKAHDAPAAASVPAPAKRAPGAPLPPPSAGGAVTGAGNPTGDAKTLTPAAAPASASAPAPAPAPAAKSAPVPPPAPAAPGNGPGGAANGGTKKMEAIEPAQAKSLGGLDKAKQAVSSEVAPAAKQSAPAAGTAPDGEAKSRDAAKPGQPDAGAAATDLGLAAKSRTLSEGDRNVLARRLERTLLALALAADIDASAAVQLAATTQPALPLDADGRVRLTVLLAADGADAVNRIAAALRESGYVVDAVEPSLRIVVLRARLESLIDLALREGVRRVEPFRGKAAEAATKVH
ncbi:MAG: VIT and VWA domain-containing protein [Phycisphaerales bacterium]